MHVVMNSGDGNRLPREDEMGQLHQGRNGIQATFGDYTIELPNILPVFERTEPRSTHHWRDAIQHRRAVRRCRRAQMKHFAEQGSAMLTRLVADHHRRSNDGGVRPV